MSTIKTIACLIALICAVPVLAQEKDRVVSGQVRLRSEVDGRGVLNDETVLVHQIRSRIRATLKPLQNISIVAEVQDSRWWGQSDPSLGRGTLDANSEGFDMHQAWAQIDSVLGVPINLRAGRQEMTYGNERLIGVSNWSNTGRSFDAARFMYASESLNLDLFASRIAASTLGPTESQNFYGLWGTVKSGKELTVDLFGLRDDNTTEITRGVDTGLAVLERYTAGTFVRMNFDPIDVELEGAIQTGNVASNDSAVRKKINAFMASITAGVTLLADTKTRLYLLGTVLSGDGGTGAGDEVAENFSTLFGTNHRFYGQLDYVPDLGGTLGLVDLSAGITSTPLKNLRVVLEGHQLKPQRVIDSTFGTEVDLTMFWRQSTAFELSGGVGVFMPGPVLTTRLNGDDTRFWVYISGQFDL
ncbi:MAG: alginate export family protein [bacterium]|nr:alginate export family protein [Candidatus Kapabacteria bacterium]